MAMTGREMRNQIQVSVEEIGLLVPGRMVVAGLLLYVSLLFVAL